MSPCPKLLVFTLVACSNGSGDDGGSAPIDAGLVDAMRADSSVDAAGSAVPELLDCEAVIMCDSHVLPAQTVTLPSTEGGAIPDGIYKAVAGVSSPLAMVFQNGRYSELSWNLLVGNGSFKIEDDRLVATLEVACSPNSEPGGNPVSPPLETRYYFHSEGDDLYIEALCLSARCDPAIHFKRVESLCSDAALGAEQCDLASCSCHEFFGQAMPDRAEGEDTCALSR